MRHHVPQETKRESRSDQSVEEKDSTFTRSSIHRRLHSEQSLKPGADVGIGPSPQIVDANCIAQQIIAVHFEQRIEIQERLDSGRGGDGHGEDIERRIRIGQTPGQHGESPEEQLEIRSSERDPEALCFFRKQPGVTHIAVHARLQQKEEKPHLMDPAAKVFAGQPMANSCAVVTNRMISQIIGIAPRW